MKKNKKDILIFSLITTFIFIILFITEINKDFSLVIITTFLLLTTAISYILFGIKKDITTILNKIIITNLIIYFLVYYIVIYLLGIKIGYSNNYLLFKDTNNLIFYLLSLIFLEITRYIVINKDTKSKINILVITILLSIISILICKSLLSLNLFIIISIIINNLFLTYLSIYFGYKVALVYKFLLEVLIIGFPILPRLSQNILSLFTIILIVILYLNLKKIYNYYQHIYNKNTFVTKEHRIIYIPFFILFIFILAIVSKDFNIYLMGIASNSMSPKLNRGDAIIVSKEVTSKNLSKNDIIVFEHDNKKIIHRIIKITKKNNKNYYQTKGDNNDYNDNLSLTIDEIEGKVYFKIPYLAYPSIKTKEMINKRKEG